MKTSPGGTAQRLRNVLIVAPHFPPSGLPPSHRARQFATHLPAYGWHPIVMTVRPEFYQEALEPELCDLVPRTVDVVRTGAWMPRRPGHWGVGDLGTRVLWHQGRAITRICRDRNVALVYLLCPPNHQLLLGRLVHWRLGIPYVFDYIDPWLSTWLQTHARPFTKLWVVHQLARMLEPLAIHRASAITSVSDGTTHGVLQRYRHLSADFAASIPYGAEPELYDRVRLHESTADEAAGVRRLLYLGAMWEAAHDTLRAFLAALRLLKDTAPDLYRTCRVDFVGTSYAPDGVGKRRVAALAAEAGVSDVVTESPRRLPFLRALAALATADTLLMLGSAERHYTPSRLLPYVFARRPIFAVMHAASDATGLLRQHDGVRLIDYAETPTAWERVPAIYEALLAWLREGRRRDLARPAARWNAHTTEALTAELATLFDRAIAPRMPREPLPAVARLEHG